MLEQIALQEYLKIETTKHVFASLKAAHPELTPIGGYSAPDGDLFGDQRECVMKTIWGFKPGGPFIIEDHRWFKSSINPIIRLKERVRYWLVIDKEEQ